MSVPTNSSSQISQSGYEKFGKRLFDIFCSFLGLMFLFPVFATLSLLIKMDSSEPILFFQKRMGRDCKPFNLIKFRSMNPGHNLEKDQFTPGDKSRVTKIGLFLRKTKMDELPELLNVLKGDMSLIGPRPEVEEYVRAYPETFRKVLRVRPGISDYASIKYRNEEHILAGADDPDLFYCNVILPDKLNLTIEYVDNMRFSTDLKIILQTLKSIL